MGNVVKHEEREDVERVCEPYHPPSSEYGIPYRQDSLQNGKQDVY